MFIRIKKFTDTYHIHFGFIP